MATKQNYEIKSVLSRGGRRERYLLKGPSGSKIVLKVFVGKDHWTKARFERETVALEHLKGLAVPRRQKISRKEVARLIKEKHFYFIATEYVPQPGCSHRRLSVAQALGLWAFTLEHLCAFRRRQILYTDIKDDHIRFAKDSSTAIIIDYNDCVMVSPGGLYPFHVLGVTPELYAPEFYFSEKLSESVLTYEMGMLLGSFLTKYFRNRHQTPSVLKKIKSKLTGVNAIYIHKLFRKCIAKKPLERPQNLEILFAKFVGAELPPAAIKLWIKLRTPYLDSLTALHFENPGAQFRLKKPARPAVEN